MRKIVNTLCAVTVLYVCLDLASQGHILDPALMALAYIAHVFNVSRRHNHTT